jgi:hypothetical protein
MNDGRLATDGIENPRVLANATGAKSKNLEFLRRRQETLEDDKLFAAPAIRLAQLRFLEYWNTFEKHDSLFQKSPLLAPSGGDRLCKTRRFQNTRVPKDLEFAPHGVSSTIRHKGR